MKGSLFSKGLALAQDKFLENKLSTNQRELFHHYTVVGKHCCLYNDEMSRYYVTTASLPASWQPSRVKLIALTYFY